MNRPPTVVGLDLSLTATGVAVITGDQALVGHYGEDGKNSDNLLTRQIRIRKLADQIMDQVAPGQARPDLVVIESPAVSRVAGHAHDRSGYWWQVVSRCIDLDLPVVEVKPNLRAKYATGKGNAAKSVVAIAAAKRYTQVDFTTDDEADALILAAMGRRLLGQPIEQHLPKDCLDSLHTITPQLSDLFIEVT